MSVWRVHQPRLLAPLLSRASHSKSHSVQNALRHLLRCTAQPVAVVTSLMPRGAQVHPSTSQFHGATLSSFSSIAMDPHPLVAFSIRIPSRMATALKTAHHEWPSHMVVNILSAAQADTALRFSRADLHPHPFSEVPYFLSEEGLPVLKGSLGALSCKLVSPPWSLHDLDALKSGRLEGEGCWDGDGVASELFIAKVVRVESVPERHGDDRLRTLPLLYHHRSYSTTRDIPSKVASNTPQKGQ